MLRLGADVGGLKKMSLRLIARVRGRLSFRRSFPLLIAVAICTGAIAAITLPGRHTVAQDRVSSPLLVTISVDGLRPDYVTQADAHGAKIANLRKILSEGNYDEGVEGVVATVISPSHTTLMRGVWPAKHGIYANTTF